MTGGYEKKPNFCSKMKDVLLTELLLKLYITALGSLGLSEIVGRNGCWHLFNFFFFFNSAFTEQKLVSSDSLIPLSPPSLTAMFHAFESN